MQRFHFVLIIFIFALLIFSCTNDQLDPDMQNCAEDITYTSEVRTVINNTCAYSGCHDGANAPGDYTSYDAMLPSLGGNDFRSRVVEIQDMPPTYASGPTSLTEEELSLINCWLSTGFKE